MRLTPAWKMAAKLEPLAVSEEAEEGEGEGEGHAGKPAARARAEGKPLSQSNRERLIAVPKKEVRI